VQFGYPIERTRTHPTAKEGIGQLQRKDRNPPSVLPSAILPLSDRVKPMTAVDKLGLHGDCSESVAGSGQSSQLSQIFSTKGG
jgi:hypothetical protein